ncbi:MgtC/SapB family protein [Lacrimispora brassicae]
MEREVWKQPAGFRTYMLVCMRSAAVMMTNQYTSQTFGGSDPSRLGRRDVYRSSCISQLLMNPFDRFHCFKERLEKQKIPGRSAPVPQILIPKGTRQVFFFL